MLGAMALGLALLIGAIMGMFAIGRPRLAPGRLASSVDQHLGLGGVAEVIYRLPQVASWSGRSPDFVSENKYLLDQLPQAVHQINPSRLIRLGRPVILAASLLMMLSAAAAGYQFLPLPKYDPVALPNPDLSTPEQQPSRTTTTCVASKPGNRACRWRWSNRFRRDQFLRPRTANSRFGI